MPTLLRQEAYDIVSVDKRLKLICSCSHPLKTIFFIFRLKGKKKVIKSHLSFKYISSFLLPLGMNWDEMTTYNKERWPPLQLHIRWCTEQREYLGALLTNFTNYLCDYPFQPFLLWSALISWVIQTNQRWRQDERVYLLWHKISFLKEWGSLNPKYIITMSFPQNTHFLLCQCAFFWKAW